MKKATIKKVTASMLVGALAATSFGTGNIAMAARNNTGSVPTESEVNWKTGKDVVSGGAIEEMFPWQDVTVITGSAMDWNDIISWWSNIDTTKDENKENRPNKDTVTGGAVTAKPEKDENKGNHSDKEVVSGGAIDWNDIFSWWTDNDSANNENKENRPGKDVVSGGAVTSKPEKGENKGDHSDKEVVSGGAIDWNDIFSWWTDNDSVNNENKGNHSDKEVVSGGAVTSKPEKDENKGNHSDKEVVSGGAVTSKPEKDENKGNHSDKEVVSGGAVTSKPEKDENKGNHSDKDVVVSGGAVTSNPEKDENKGNHSDKDVVVSGGAVTTNPDKNNTSKTDKKTTKKNKKVKVKKAKKTAKNKIKVTLDGTNVWKNVKVSVKTSSGKTVKAKIVKKTKNYCVIKTTKKLEKKTYVIKIKGVKVKGASSYETITTKVKVK